MSDSKPNDVHLLTYLCIFLVTSLLLEARDSSAKSSFDQVDSPAAFVEHEYDYCEVETREEPTSLNPEPVKPSTTISSSSPHIEQDHKYLQYYSHHVHAICENVKQNAVKLQTVIETGQSNQTLVNVSKTLVSTAHKLVYIGDTLSRSLRQPVVRSEVSADANQLCNVLKDFIMCTKEAALAEPAARSSALAKLRDNISSVQRQTESFQNIISKRVSVAPKQ